MGERHVLTYGVNARRINFDLNIGPLGDNREEKGVFLQDEILLSDKVRWLNHYMSSAIVAFVELPFVGFYGFPTATLGNLDLTEERCEAYEIGYVGDLTSKTTVTLSLCRNEIKDYIDFYPTTFYTAANPPPGWPLPPILLDTPPPLGVAGTFPASFSFRNVGEIVDQGFEASLRLRPSPRRSLFGTYSYQEDPEVGGIPE